MKTPGSNNTLSDYRQKKNGSWVSKRASTAAKKRFAQQMRDPAFRKKWMENTRKNRFR